MVDITLLEVHLDDATFTANAPFSDGSDDASSTSESGSTDSSSDRPSAVGLLVGLVVLIGIGLAVRKLLGSDKPDLSNVEEFDSDS